MKENDSFSMCHPLLNFFYFAVALLLQCLTSIRYFLGFLMRVHLYTGIVEWMAKDPEAGIASDTSGTSDHSIAESYV